MVEAAATSYETSALKLSAFLQHHMHHSTEDTLSSLCFWEREGERGREREREGERGREREREREGERGRERGRDALSIIFNRGRSVACGLSRVGYFITLNGPLNGHPPSIHESRLPRNLMINPKAWHIQNRSLCSYCYKFHACLCFVTNRAYMDRGLHDVSLLSS